MSSSVYRPRTGRSASAFESNSPEPPSATGMYPNPVWATAPGAATAKAQGRSKGGSRVQPRPAAGRSRASGWSRAAGDAPADVAPPELKESEPASPTGQYPGPVWTTQQPLAKANRAARVFNDAPAAAREYPAHFKELGYSDDLAGVVPAESIADSATVVLTNEAIYRIVREVALADSGAAAYSATSPDAEFSTSGNPAYQRRQFGLGFGLLLSTQESGRLGRILALTRQRDAAVFAEALGPNAESVLAVTSSKTPEERLQPVDGEPLWSPSWVERFRRLGQAEACQYAQNEEAIEGLFRPMWKVAEGIGLTSERGLAMLFDRVVTCGLGEGLRWALSVAGPLRTPEQRTFALQSLGFETLRDFQASVSGLASDGNFGAETYGALVAALRAQGLVSLPLPADYVSRMLAAAAGVAQSRLMRLRDSAALGEVLYRAS